MSTPWWLVASNLKGIAEIHGALDNPAIVEMSRIIGQGGVGNDEVPWCAAFVGACLQLSGYQSSRSLAARSYLAFGDALSDPKRGCIVVLSWRAGNQRKNHVGFFLKEKNGRVFLLGGNQGDSVKIASFPASHVKALRWPTQKGPVATSALLRNIDELGGGAVPPDGTAPIAPDEETRWLRARLDDDGQDVTFVPLRAGPNGPRASDIRELQKKLKAKRYAVGEVDGIYGPLTEMAVFAFQSANGLPANGVVDAETWFALPSGRPMPTWTERRKETPSDLREDGSQTIALTDSGRMLAILTTALGALGVSDAHLKIFQTIGSSLSQAMSSGAPAVSPARAAAAAPSPSVTAWTPPADVAAAGADSTLANVLPVLFGSQGGVWIAMIAAAGLLWRNADQLAAQRVKEHRTGSNLRF